MVILILTSQPEIGHLFEEVLPKHTCLIFDSLEKFYSVVRILKEKPELIVCDYMMFNHLLFNIYDFLNTHFQQTPLIFYNDPQPLFDDLVYNWKQILTMTKKEYVKYDWDILIPIFEKIRDVIENPNISQYIYLMQKPESIPNSFSYSSLFQPNNLKSLINTLNYEAKKAKMPENLINLSILLLQNNDEGISTEELWKQYSKNYSEITYNSFKTKMSLLKNFLKEHQLNFTIVKIDDKFKMIYKKNRSSEN